MFRSRCLPPSWFATQSHYALRNKVKKDLRRRVPAPALARDASARVPARRVPAPDEARESGYDVRTVLLPAEKAGVGRDLRDTIEARPEQRRALAVGPERP
jgi:hypothetical protein